MRVSLWPDTNFARDARRFLVLLREAARVQVPVCVHALVYLETRRYRRVKSGANFDGPRFDAVFDPDPQGIVPTQFGPLEVGLPHARRWSDTLATRYPTDADWQAIKRQALRANTGAEVGETRHAPMTTDWWIALSLEELDGAHVITDDKGPEWEPLRKQGRVLTATEVGPWLARRAAP
jgi:hypothetical protein